MKLPAIGPRVPQLAARCSLAFCFISIGLWEITDPEYWFGYVPSFAMKLGDISLMVRAHGAILTLIGAVVLFGVRLRLASGLAVLMLLQIVVALAAESGFTEILLRDIVILGLAISVFAEASVAKRTVA